MCLVDSYTWYKDDIEVQNSTQVKNYQNGSLIISSMSEEAQGKYMCSAKTTFSGGLFAVALSKEFDISMLSEFLTPLRKGYFLIPINSVQIYVSRCVCLLLLLLQRSTAVQVRSSVRLMPQNQPSGRGLLPSPTAWLLDLHHAAMLADVSWYILDRTEGRGLGFGQLVRTHTGKCLKCQSSSDGALRPQCPVRRRKIVVCWACSSLQIGSRCA